MARDNARRRADAEKGVAMRFREQKGSGRINTWGVRGRGTRGLCCTEGIQSVLIPLRLVLDTH